MFISRQRNKAAALYSMGWAQGLLFCSVGCQAVLELPSLQKGSTHIADGVVHDVNKSCGSSRGSQIWAAQTLFPDLIIQAVHQQVKSTHMPTAVVRAALFHTQSSSDRGQLKHGACHQLVLEGTHPSGAAKVMHEVLSTQAAKAANKPPPHSHPHQSWTETDK